MQVANYCEVTKWNVILAKKDLENSDVYKIDVINIKNILCHLTR